MPSATHASVLETINQWKPILLGLDETTVRHKPTPERWSISEVVGHMVDSACNNHQRFVRAQAVEQLAFPAYDQNAWVAAGDYQRLEWRSLVELWHCYNQLIAHIMAQIADSQRATRCTIGNNDPVTLGFVMDDYLVHMQHHLTKIAERIGLDQ
jgi:hypothetical protein